MKPGSFKRRGYAQYTLDNLSLGATQRMMQYRAQRALRDGVLDGDTGQVLDKLSEEDA